MNTQEFYNLPIIGILRGITESMVEPIAVNCISAGLKALEITMNTKNAPDLIRKMKEYSEGKLFVGAGTVISMQDLENALKAGASFIVQPTIKENIIKECLKNNIPVFPGALTPTEILTAWELGATMVKVFPANVFGPKYMKEIKGPLNNVKLLACGGISDKTIADYFNNGADGAAFGGSIFNLEQMGNNQYDKVKQDISNLISAYKNSKL